MKIQFHLPVSAISGNFVPGTIYDVAEEIAQDMIRAGHAIEAAVEVLKGGSTSTPPAPAAAPADPLEDAPAPETTATTATKVAK